MVNTEKENAPVEKKERNTTKLDFLRAIEKNVQEQWEKDKIFEQDAPEDGSGEKYLVTFPYPYMNGRLHLGHCFTITKAEFAASYQRLKGKRALFPFGFHCTGMPIKASADKIAREIELYGNPPQFPKEDDKKTEEQKEEEHKPVPPENTGEAANAASTKIDPTAFHAKKAKVVAKSSGAKFQWQIMESIGVPSDEIARFADANYWLKYFPPHCVDDLKKFGAAVDWRRSFITTEVNPYYDSFVRWQFEILKDLDKVKFGKRLSVYSPKDGQPCADHDRASGEGVLPQEYTLIKLQVVEPLPEKLKSLSGKKVYMVPGTLRPETMYGQTNIWVLPEGEYGAFEINETDVFICTERAARNMAYQGLSKEFGKVVNLLPLKGWDLLGVAVKPPLSKYPVIYALPMSTISPKKGTGIVTSVPSDSPDDYTSFEELRNKPAYRSKFGITDEMIMPFEIIEIIDVPELGKNAAMKVCKDMKISGPKDVNLAKAKELVYTKGFYEGKLIVGEHAGKSVQDAKPLIRDQMINSGEAVAYAEPADVVMSRSGDECVVCYTDQWYMDYGEEKWREKTENHMKTMQFFDEDTSKKFKYALGWMNKWACSRTYGLGTKLPWDEKYLIESLSDSTIYNAYYSVAYLLQGGVIDGSKVGPAGIKAEQLTRPVWNYIFLEGEYPSGCGIDEEVLKKLRREFQYWYPVDLRCSGKDLITNHLTFYLYNHTAIFPKEERWPRGIRANGFMLLNSKKMSKSEGNFLTLFESVEKFSSDGTRFALADAGDGLDDANFLEATADAAILRIWTQIKWVEEILDTKDMRETVEFADRVFEAEMNRLIRQTEQHYERTNFRDALQSGFYAMQDARDRYKLHCAEKGFNRNSILKFIEYQAIIMAPFIPHSSEHIWKLLGKTGSIRFTKWPESHEETPEEVILIQQKEYLFREAHNFRLRKDTFLKPKKGKEKEKVPDPKKATIHVAATYPHWKAQILTMLKPMFESGSIDAEGYEKEIMKFVGADVELKKHMKKIMPFVANVKGDYKIRGKAVLELKSPFDELQYLNDNIEYLKKSLDVESMTVKSADEEMISAERCSPGSPCIIFE